MCVCVCYSVTCLCIHFICFEQGLKKHQIHTKHQNGRLGRLGSDRACLPGNRVQGAGNLFLGRIGRYSTVPDELDLGGATAIHVPGTLGVCR